jgi:hypothetical protein
VKISIFSFKKYLPFGGCRMMRHLIKFLSAFLIASLLLQTHSVCVSSCPCHLLGIFITLQSSKERLKNFSQGTDMSLKWGLRGISLFFYFDVLLLL